LSREIEIMYHVERAQEHDPSRSSWSPYLSPRSEPRFDGGWDRRPMGSAEVHLRTPRHKIFPFHLTVADIDRSI
jgi:hypothetical protein